MPQDPHALSRKDFERLAAFIEERFGVRMPAAKRTMLEARLGRRVRDLGVSFAAYCDRVLAEGATDELVEFVDRVTTHKTDFFREPRHFEVLVDRVVPALLEGPAAGRELRVWSAACSTGEEPYTLAMVLAEATARWPDLRFRILGTDLSPGVLRQAERALYTEQVVGPIPLPLRRRWLLRSVEDPDVVRVCKALRERVAFRRLNLLDEEYGLGQPQDVIFCRNVLIYFERAVQLQVVRRLGQALSPGGFLFLGHSETLPARELPLHVVAPTVYRRPLQGGGEVCAT